MKRIIAIGLFFMLAQLPCFSQGYGAVSIPAELSRGSNAVVRDYRMEFVYNSETSASEKVSAAVTVMNKEGEDAAYIAIHTDMFSTLKSFSGEVLDRSGKTIRKLKRSDLEYSDYFKGLASDNRTWYIATRAAEYPYTIVYEYELTHKDGILSFPVFAPVDDFNIAVEKASYVLSVPSGTRIYIKPLNTDAEPSVGNVKNSTVYSWTLSGLKPVVSEPYSPGYLEVFPVIFVTPHNFTFNGKSGTMDNWEGYSSWQWSLMEGRDVLPEECTARVKEITADCVTDRDKVRKLYEYLAQTRYVSMQIGVGGFQPMSASEVYNNKFGDCKGLSNYMKALLAECGIESYYVEIGFGNTKLREDYVHPSQTNHAILYVPLEEEEIWLECTNPGLPLGYVHSDISDRKALVYREGTAVVVDMPAYPDTVNISILKAEATLSVTSEMRAHVSTTYRMSQYEKVIGFDKINGAEKLHFVNRTVNIPLAEISGINYREEKSSSPWGEVDYDIKFKINFSGDRGFIPVNPFRSNSAPRLRRNRNLDITVRNGYCNVDRVSFEIPAGYSVESLPAPAMVNNRFGQFLLVVSKEGDRITVLRRMQMNKGTYGKEHYGEFRELVEKIAYGNGQNIVIVKR